ncbi:unnamed protein product [Phytophthora fragariaefolia]|uniref:Unnamed protein product n=1 Tax=Phytophthora fragariaefolia TaxID=1490495 RepID=A0A9W6TTH4_9STRA|nr:unnamed protein product [Phytophthora fragariaefolia]
MATKQPTAKLEPRIPKPAMGSVTPSARKWLGGPKRSAPGADYAAHRQSGRLWTQHLRATLLKLGFRQCYTDSCIYVRGSGADLTLVGVYVDDLLVTGASEAKVDKFYTDMSVLDVKNLGMVSKFLGMAISYDEERWYRLEQRQTIEELQQRFGLAEANPVRAPVSDDQDGEDDGELLPNSGGGAPANPTVRLFQSLVGSLLWVARRTRLDIALAVHRVTRTSHAPREADWRRAKRIARYLNGIIDLKLCLEGARATPIETGVRIEGYSDADYAADREDRTSVSGGMLYMDDMILGWFCKKQTSVAPSTKEAEFVAW